MSDDIIKQAIERGEIEDISVEDEMHRLQRWRLNAKTASDELLDAVLSGEAGPTFDDWLAASRRKLVSELMSGGWPDPEMPVTVDSKSWHAAPNAPLEEERVEHTKEQPKTEVLAGLSYILQRSKTLEPDWFRATLLKSILMINATRGSDRDWAIFNLGRTFATALSRRHMPNVSRGKKTRRSASEGGRARVMSMARTRNDVLSEMQTFVDKGKPVAHAARITANRGIGTSAAANKSAWYRYANRKKKI